MNCFWECEGEEKVIGRRLVTRRCRPGQRDCEWPGVLGDKGLCHISKGGETL